MAGLLLGGTRFAWAQSSFLQQGFEAAGNNPLVGAAGGQLLYSATGGGLVYSGTFLSASGNSANALPNPGTVSVEGTSSFGAVNNTGNGNTTGVVTFNAVSFPVTTGNYLQFRLASYQTNSNGGLDNATANNGVQVDIAYNGSSTFTPTLRILGQNNGSVFLYSATGIATTTVTGVSPALVTLTSPDDRTGNGQSLAITGTAGLSTARVNFGPAITRVQVRITVAVNGKTGVFLDDVRIGSNGPLPVELTRFAAEATAAGTQVRWATASEKNNAGFEVQRRAVSGAFQTIGQVAGQGSSSASHSYSWLDATPLPGLSYYRLRQSDLDGAESFSPVVAVQSAGKRQADFFPNPTTDHLTLAPSGGPIRYRILNSLGQTQLTGEATGSSTISLQSLRAGAYVLELQTAEGRQLQRFVREL